jgi:hypothetical protein
MCRSTTLEQETVLHTVKTGRRAQLMSQRSACKQPYRCLRLADVPCAPVDMGVLHPVVDGRQLPSVDGLLMVSSSLH